MPKNEDIGDSVNQKFLKNLKANEFADSDSQSLLALLAADKVPKAAEVHCLFKQINSQTGVAE